MARCRDPAAGLDPSPLVLFAALGVKLEQQPEGGEAEHEGLSEPHAAGGCAVDALVSVKESSSQCVHCVCRHVRTTSESLSQTTAERATSEAIVPSSGQ